MNSVSIFFKASKQKLETMILPMYTEQERKELKQELKVLIKWLDNNHHKQDTKEYDDKDEECSNLYDIIHDL